MGILHAYVAAFEAEAGMLIESMLIGSLRSEESLYVPAKPVFGRVSVAIRPLSTPSRLEPKLFIATPSATDLSTQMRLEATPLSSTALSVAGPATSSTGAILRFPFAVRLTTCIAATGRSLPDTAGNESALVAETGARTLVGVNVNRGLLATPSLRADSSG